MTTIQRVKARTAGKPFEVFDISGHERDRLFTLDENHFCDVKAIEIAPAKLTRTLSAFANYVIDNDGDRDRLQRRLAAAWVRVQGWASVATDPRAA